MSTYTFSGIPTPSSHITRSLTVLLKSLHFSFLFPFLHSIHSDPLRYHPPVSPSVPAPVPTAGPPYYTGQTVYPPSPPIIVPTPQQPPPAKREKKTVSTKEVSLSLFFCRSNTKYYSIVICFFSCLHFLWAHSFHVTLIKKKTLTIHFIISSLYVFYSDKVNKSNI